MIGYLFWRHALFSYSRHVFPLQASYGGAVIWNSKMHICAQLAVLLSRSVHKVTPCLLTVWPLKVKQSFLKIWSICGMILARAGPKCSQRNPPQCHFVLRKSHTGMAGIKPGSLQWQADDKPPEPWNIIARVINTRTMAKQFTEGSSATLNAVWIVC